MSKCATCSQELKVIPAGVSKKTGRAYNSFTACPNKCQQPRSQGSSSTPSHSGDDGFKIMADEFIALKNKIEELLAEIKSSVIGQ